MTISLETACERILGNRVAQAIINDQGLGWAIVAAVAKALTTDDAEAIAELKRYPHAMHQEELDRAGALRRKRKAELASQDDCFRLAGEGVKIEGEK